MKKPVCKEVGFGHILSYKTEKRMSGERKKSYWGKERHHRLQDLYIESHNVSRFRPEKWEYFFLRKDRAGYAGFKEVLRTEAESTWYQKFDQVSYWFYRPDFFL